MCSGLFKSFPNLTWQPCRGLWNSNIWFVIRISETKPCRTELFLEFRKSLNSETLLLWTFHLASAVRIQTGVLHPNTYLRASAKSDKLLTQTSLLSIGLKNTHVFCSSVPSITSVRMLNIFKRSLSWYIHTIDYLVKYRLQIMQLVVE